MPDASADAPLQTRVPNVKISKRKKKKAPLPVVPKHQRDFIPWRLAFTNEGERDPELDSCFYHVEQEVLYKEVYCNIG